MICLPAKSPNITIRNPVYPRLVVSGVHAAKNCTEPASVCLFTSPPIWSSRARSCTAARSSDTSSGSPKTTAIADYCATGGMRMSVRSSRHCGRLIAPFCALPSEVPMAGSSAYPRIGKGSNLKQQTVNCDLQKVEPHRSGPTFAISLSLLFRLPCSLGKQICTSTLQIRISMDKIPKCRVFTP